MAKRWAANLVHPVGLPTLLPTGQVRVDVLHARKALGLSYLVPGDCDILTERYCFKPITTPTRNIVIGLAVYDEVARELAFNVVPGFHGVTREGLPLIMKLSRELFLNLTTGQMMEFNADCTRVELHTTGKIEGVPASRLYRMLEQLTIRDRDRWRRTFPADPVAKGEVN